MTSCQRDYFSVTVTVLLSCHVKVVKLSRHSYVTVTVTVTARCGAAIVDINRWELAVGEKCELCDYLSKV